MRRLLTLFIQKNNAPQEESDDEEDETPPAKLIKSTNEFLAIIDQQKAFMKRNKLPVKLVKQLETLIVGNQKLSGAAARDKLMAMRDSDVSSLDTESDSQSLTSLQE